MIIRSSIAQDPLIVNPILTPPYPNYADEIVNMGDQVLINIQNTDFNNSYSFKLNIDLSGQNGIEISTKPEAQPSQPISIGPGETLSLTGAELDILYNNYNESDFDYSGISLQDVINDQQLPDGIYTICVQAVDFNNGDVLSASSPQGCTAPFTVIAVDPPILTYPDNNTEVMVVDPQLINITWIPVTANVTDLRYRLEMVDVSNAPINTYDAFLTGDFLFFSQDDIIGNSFIYGLEHPALEIGNEYAIRVRAYRQDGLLNVQNQGYSDIVTFTYGEPDTSDTDEIDNEIVLNQDIPDQEMGCGSGCYVTNLTDMSPAQPNLQIGDQVTFGKFQLVFTLVNGNNGVYAGEGVIQATGYLPVGIKVEFTGLRVNQSMRVIEGEASAILIEDYWFPHTWSDFETALQNIDRPNSFAEAWDSYGNPQYHLDNLESVYQQTGARLPINIGDGETKLQICGMHFFPDHATHNLAFVDKMEDDPTGERYLSFLGKNLCLTPGGPALSAEEARLELTEPLRYTFNEKTVLTFKPKTSDLTTGTYLSFDCNGFNSINATGNVRFDPSVFKAVTADGGDLPNDTLIGCFHAEFMDLDDWTAYFSVSCDDMSDNDDYFQYDGLDDYVMSLETGFIDKSLSENPPTMAFPENYSGDTDPTWQGVYFKEISVSMPSWIKSFNDDGEVERVKLEGRDLLVDNSGLSGVISGSGLLNPGDGALSTWPLTVDSVSISIFQNSLAGAYFTGGLKIPVIEEPFEYTADIQNLFNGTHHTFNFSPVGDYSFPTFFAETTISSNSFIEVVASTEETYAEANLHGDISFAPVIGDIDKTSLTDITYENMIVRSKRDPTFIEIGEFGTNLSPQALAVAGFGVVINELDWEENNLQESGLLLGLGLNLAGGVASISGGTELFIENSIENYADSVDFTFTGTNVESIYIEAETGAVNIVGEVSFFKNDADFGSGFDGSLQLAFLESITIDGKVLFGNKEENGEEFNYWYAYAMAYLPSAPVPMATPLDIYGFGGGVYYNMSINTDFPNPGAVGGSNVDPREAFNVEQGFAGIQASVVTGLTPSSQTFNADVTLTAELNLNTFGLNYIALTGNGYVMQDIEEPDKESAMISATVAISYDFPNKTFAADFGVEGNVPGDTPLLVFTGDISFYRSPTLWYFKAGVPTSPLSTTYDLGIAGISADAYFMTGQQLPPPVLPAEVEQFFDFESNLINNTQNGLGIGFMAGVHLGLNVDLSLVGTGIQIVALAGVDIAVLHYYAATCNGSEDFGVNKWYAMGQGYLYGSFTLEVVGVEVAGLEAGVILEGAFPNPTGIQGQLQATVTVLGTDHSVNESFSIGSFCDIQPMANIDEIVERKEVELETLDMVGVVTPSNGATFVSTNAQPTIQWLIEDESTRHYTYGDGLGGIVDKTFKFYNREYWYKQTESGGWATIDFDVEFDEEDNISTLRATNAAGQPSLLFGNAAYKVKAESVIKENVGDQWVPALYLEGDQEGEPIEEIVEHVFTTQTSLTEIEPLFVDYTLPFGRQRYFPYDYLQTGQMRFNIDHEPKFQDFESCGFEIQAEFEPLNSGNPVVIPVTRENLLRINYGLETLQPSTTYKAQIVAQRSISSEELENETNENCQVNTGNTLADLMDGLNFDDDYDGFDGNINLESIYPGGVYNTETSGIIDFTETPDTVIQRKVLYTFHFRTSMYGTPQEKLDAMTISDVEVVPQMYYSFPSPYIIDDAIVSVSCGEGFDKYDVLGHDYSEQAGLTNEYFSFSGVACNAGFELGVNMDVTGEVEDWYDQVCAELYSFGGSNASGQNPGGNPNDPFIANAQMVNDMIASVDQIWEVFLNPDPSNYTGYENIQPLLSDEELGLVPPADNGPFDPSSLGLFGQEEDDDDDESDSSGGFGIGSWGGSGYGYNEPIDASGIMDDETNSTPLLGSFSGSSGNNALRLKYSPDRQAYNARQQLQGIPTIGDLGPHISPPSGIYPMRIALSNFTLDPDNGAPTGTDRIFDVNIPF